MEEFWRGGGGGGYQKQVVVGRSKSTEMCLYRFNYIDIQFFCLCLTGQHNVNWRWSYKLQVESGEAPSLTYILYFSGLQQYNVLQDLRKVYNSNNTMQSLQCYNWCLDWSKTWWTHVKHKVKWCDMEKWKHQMNLLFTKMLCYTASFFGDEKWGRRYVSRHNSCPAGLG